jgi:hypothetical protein
MDDNANATHSYLLEKNGVDMVANAFRANG